jgi:protoporphyrinogen/coproporphyrinogen III oxidase
LTPDVRVAVIGGGISGLATAYFLRHTSEGPPPAITLIEASDRVGGKVLTREIAGAAVDTGPDCIPARPLVRALFDELGLGPAVVAAAPMGVYVWSKGKLRRLPAGTFFGVPDRLLPLVRSRLLSPSGTVRAGLDLVRPRQPLPDDATIEELLRPRFGDQLLERLVEPMLSGIQAGDANTLSARSAVPDIDALVRNSRSVILALQRRRRSANRAKRAGRGHRGPGLVTLDGGLGQLIDALVDELAGVDIVVDSPAVALERVGAGFRVHLGGGGAVSEVDADAVVFATPAFVTADLVEPFAPDAAVELRAVPYVDVATVTLAYAASAVGHPLDGTGFLVPSCEGRLIVGCTWLNAKWQHLRDHEVRVFRAFVGRSDDERAMAMDDVTLTRNVHEELREAIGLTGLPLECIVQRWPRAVPQYTVGHQRRVERAVAALARTPGLHLTGAAYEGVGTASCIAQAAKTASGLVESFMSGAGVGRIA